MSVSCHRRIRQKIETMPQGSVFVISDFDTIACPKTVSKTLKRLSEDGLICRVIRGVFWKPQNSADAPSPDQIAHALARGNIWRVAPCGETALHLFGLKSTTPRIWTYITDGTQRDYDIAGIRLIFRHSSGKFLGSMSEKAATVVQVLKAYGKPQLSEETLVRIRQHLKPEELRHLLSETKNAPAWICAAIRTMLHKTDPAEHSVSP